MILSILYVTSRQIYLGLEVNVVDLGDFIVFCRSYSIFFAFGDFLGAFDWV
jgi:hypothetical protein